MKFPVKNQITLVGAFIRGIGVVFQRFRPTPKADTEIRTAIPYTLKTTDAVVALVFTPVRSGSVRLSNVSACKFRSQPE